MSLHMDTSMCTSTHTHTATHISVGIIQSGQGGVCMKAAAATPFKLGNRILFFFFKMIFTLEVEVIYCKSVCVCMCVYVCFNVVRDFRGLEQLNRAEVREHVRHPSGSRCHKLTVILSFDSLWTL